MFIDGIYNTQAGRQQKYINHLPPTSAKDDGATLLDPDIMRIYIQGYNEVFLDPANIETPKIKAKSNFISFTSFMEKKGCK